MNETCPSCHTPVMVATGIGSYCPNAACDRIDDLDPNVKPLTPRARLDAARATLDPLHGLLMAQSTHRLGEIHRLTTEIETLRRELAHRNERLLQFAGIALERDALRTEVESLKRFMHNHPGEA